MYVRPSVAGTEYRNNFASEFYGAAHRRVHIYLCFYNITMLKTFNYANIGCQTPLCNFHNNGITRRCAMPVLPTSIYIYILVVYTRRSITSYWYLRRSTFFSASVCYTKPTSVGVCKRYSLTALSMPRILSDAKFDFSTDSRDLCACGCARAHVAVTLYLFRI